MRETTSQKEEAMRFITVATLFFFTSVALAAPQMTKIKVQDTMETYVKTLIKENGFLPVLHKGKVLKLKLKTSKKYPSGFHAGVKTKGKLYTSCADFQDNEGNNYDIDFLVSKTGKKFQVVQPIVHAKNGVKDKYDLGH